MVILVSDWLRHFYFLSAIDEQNSTKFHKNQDFNILYLVRVFRADLKQRKPPWPLISRKILTSSLELLNKIQWNLTGPKTTFSTKFEFSGCQIGRPRWPPWPLIRHIRLLCNHWTEFDKTWRGARSQRPLPSLCFSRLSENQNDRPCLWLANCLRCSIVYYKLPLIFAVFSATTGRNSMKLDWKHVLTILYEVCIFGLSFLACVPFH